jgi:hypothetical protein
VRDYPFVIAFGNLVAPFAGFRASVAREAHQAGCGLWDSGEIASIDRLLPARKLAPPTDLLVRSVYVDGS